MKENRRYKGHVNKETVTWAAAAMVLAVTLFTFFTVAHPLYIYDTDDWTYISYSRHGWPTVSQWNPTKVLPETLMPLTAELGIRFIMPFTGDYIESMAIAFAAVLVLFISGYVYMFAKAIQKLFEIKTELAVVITAAFVLYHFLPFSVHTSGNRYLLYGGSVNCTFNYLIPGLLNAAIVMWFTGQKNEIKFKPSLSTGLFILLVYLALNSNMFHSIILASYAGTNIMISFTEKGALSSKRFKSKAKENIVWILIELVWFAMLTFEVRGARAARSSVKLLDLPVMDTLKKFKNSFMDMNKLFWVSMFGFICLGILVYGINRYKKNIQNHEERYMKAVVKIVISFLITWIYLILLCAKVSPGYITNNLVEISWIFWIMLWAFISLGYIFVKIPKLSVCIPIFVYILIFETVIDGKTYAENNVAGFDSATVKALDENIIKQIIEAEECGQRDVTVYIPVHPSQDWPMALSYGGGRIATSLFRHGIITHKMNVILEMDPVVNEKFHLH